MGRSQRPRPAWWARWLEIAGARLARTAQRWGLRWPRSAFAGRSTAAEGAGRWTTIDQFLAADRPRIIAHRGVSSRAPENTLVAIRQAIASGADMVEIDVTRTLDGVLIVLHDETLDRTTNGSGRALETPYETIRRLDAGSWFAADFAGEVVPTLDQVLTLVKDRILLNIEIKGEAVADRAEGGVAEAVARRVEHHAMVDQVLVSSFDPRALAQLRDLARGGVVPRLTTASLFDPALHRDLAPSAIAAQVGATAFHVGVHQVTGEQVAEAHRAGLLVAVYTVNRVSTWRQLLDLDVDAVFTDAPNRLLAALAEARAVDGGQPRVSEMGRRSR